MRLHFRTRNPQRPPNEEELIQADARVQESRGSPRTLNSPERLKLQRFVRGEYSPSDPECESITEHLLDCDVDVVAELRSQKAARTRPVLMAAVAIILVAVSFWVVRIRINPVLATADLRQVTRSSEGSSIVLQHKASTLRVVLPEGSNNGEYEVGIFKMGEPTPVLVSSSRPRYENGVLVIDSRISLNRLTPGRYLLGIRYASSDWNQYLIDIK